ncbi:MAG: glycosyltransferase family 2 protein [Methyloligellaceae bacterium]
MSIGRTPVDPDSISGAISSKIFVLAICTYQRPQMLLNCLASINKIDVPSDWSLEVVVIDNEPALSSKKKDIDVNFELFYRHEPIRGIPNARNNAINFALERRAEVLGFIDDDETVSNNWLQSMLTTFEKYECDVVQGPVKHKFEWKRPFWLSDPSDKERETGTQLNTAATNNVSLNCQLIAPSPHGLNLRFDEDLRFTGGSDTAFFYKATDLGATIVWSNEPVVTESIPVSRATMLWHLRRVCRTEANASLLYKNRKGVVKAVVKYTPKITIRLCKATGLSIAVILMLPLGKKVLAKTFFRAARNAMTATGAFLGLFNIQLQPYKKTDGY